MATGIASRQLLLANYGNSAFRAASTLPQTATTTYFNVVGGQVLITSIFGVITTATGATATNLTINATNTAGATTVAIGAQTAVTSKAAGTILAIPTIGGTLTALAYGVQNNEFVLGPGAIQFVTDASDTGAWKWYVNYIGLDSGAYVSVA